MGKSKSPETAPDGKKIKAPRKDPGVQYIYTKSSKTLNEIKKAYLTLYERNLGIPTIKDISDETNISVRQIKRHLHNIDWLEAYKEFFKMYIPEVMHGALAQARKGNIPAGKFYMQVIGDWSERQEFEVKSGGQALKAPQIVLNLAQEDIPPEKQKEG